MLAGITARTGPVAAWGSRYRTRSVEVQAAKRGAAKKKTKQPKPGKTKRATTYEPPTQELLQEYHSVATATLPAATQHLDPTSQDAGKINQLLDDTINNLLTQAVSDTRVTSSSPSLAAGHATPRDGLGDPAAPAVEAAASGSPAEPPRTAAAAAPEPQAASPVTAASSASTPTPAAKQAEEAAAGPAGDWTSAAGTNGNSNGSSRSKHTTRKASERPAPATVPDAVQQLLSLPQLTPSSLLGSATPTDAFTPVGDAPATAVATPTQPSASSNSAAAATAASPVTAAAVPPPVTPTVAEAPQKATAGDVGDAAGDTSAAKPATAAAAEQPNTPAPAAAGQVSDSTGQAATAGGSAAALASLLLPRLTNAASDLGEVEGHVGRLARLMTEASSTLTSLKDFSSSTEVPLLNIMSDILGDITQEMDLVQLQLRAARAGLDATYTHVTTAAAGGPVEAAPTAPGTAAMARAAAAAGGGDNEGNTTQLLAQLSLKSQQSAAAEAQVEALRSQLALALQPSLRLQGPEDQAEGGQDLIKQQVLTNLALLGQLEALTRTILSQEAALASGRDSPEDGPAAAAAVVEAVQDMVKLVGDAGMQLTASVRQLQEASEAPGHAAAEFGLSIEDLKAAAATPQEVEQARQ